jgi:hypothetical protein
MTAGDGIVTQNGSINLGQLCWMNRSHNTGRGVAGKRGWRQWMICLHSLPVTAGPRESIRLICFLTRYEPSRSWASDMYEDYRKRWPSYWRLRFQVLLQVLNFAQVITTGLMVWKGLGIVTNTESPIVVVLRLDIPLCVRFVIMWHFITVGRWSRRSTEAICCFSWIHVPRHMSWAI